MADRPDSRIDSVVVREGDGKVSSMDSMVSWMLGVLSGGNVEAYAQGVLRRAAEATQASA
ncbi:MAG: hypothetical protein GXY67_10440 [Clostridiales bacterium]|nr:hypothetical protein [Clostridiales bacterium]